MPGIAPGTGTKVTDVTNDAPGTPTKTDHPHRDKASLGPQGAPRTNVPLSPERPICEGARGMNEPIMPSVAVRTLARPGEVMPSEGWISEQYGGLVESWRRSQGHGVVVFVRLQRPDPTDWVTLGGHLLTPLLDSGGHVGVALDGDWPAETILGWLAARLRSEGTGILQVTFHTSRLPEDHPLRGALVGDLECRSIEPVHDAGWVRSIWRETGSDLFVHASALLLAVFESSDVESDLDERSHRVFDDAFGRARAWIEPSDGNLGFRVGVLEGSPLHQALQSLGSHEPD